MKAPTAFQEFPPAARRYAEAADPDPDSQLGSNGDFQAFHKVVHQYLDEVREGLEPLVGSTLNQERSVNDERSKLPIYHYWWVEGDQAFLQVDTRDPAIVLGKLHIVVSSEKNTTPERVEAIRNLATDNRFCTYCRAGRRNTRWSFLYLDLATTSPETPKQIAEMLAAIHKIEQTNFPRTHTGRFR